MIYKIMQVFFSVMIIFGLLVVIYGMGLFIFNELEARLVDRIEQSCAG